MLAIIIQLFSNSYATYTSIGDSLTYFLITLHFDGVYILSYFFNLLNNSAILNFFYNYYFLVKINRFEAFSGVDWFELFSIDDRNITFLNIWNHFNKINDPFSGDVDFDFILSAYYFTQLNGILKDVKTSDYIVLTYKYLNFLMDNNTNVKFIRSFIKDLVSHSFRLGNSLNEIENYKNNKPQKLIISNQSFRELSISDYLFEFIFSTFLWFFVFSIFFMLIIYVAAILNKFKINKLNMYIEKIFSFFENDVSNYSDIKIFFFIFFIFFILIFYYNSFLIALVNPFIIFKLYLLLVIFLTFILPVVLLFLYGLFFLVFVKGLGKNYSWFAQYSFDSINFISFFIRFFLQNIRIVLILMVYTAYHEFITNGAALSFCTIFFYTGYLIIYFLFYVRLCFEWFDLVLILLLQLASFVLILLWLFFFLFSTNLLENKELIFFFKKKFNKFFK